MNLKMKIHMNKKIKVLVTAGPTWVPIDRVRVITSVFSGNTGLRIARYIKDQGHDVTLFMGPRRPEYIDGDSDIKLKQFWYYEDLKKPHHCTGG